MISNFSLSNQTNEEKKTHSLRTDGLISSNRKTFVKLHAIDEKIKVTNSQDERVDVKYLKART